MSLNYKAFWHTGAQWESEAILKHLSGGYTIRQHRLKQISGQMLDSFEGHLRRSGLLLLQLPARLVLANLITGDLFEQDGAPGWTFAEKLPEGLICDQLLQLTKLRAFSDIGTVALEQCQVLVMDELEKTVVRARVTTLSHDSGQATCLALSPLRGYDNEIDLLANALYATGFEAIDSSFDYYPAIGINRALYTSKPDIVLGWDRAVYDSATQIAGTFLEVARQNEEGILADTDTEFLHDYRVSLRRVRSLLSLFRNVYGREDCRHAQNELADLMKQTNLLRDLDVYLMDRARFFELVPESMFDGLDSLFEVFVQERRKACESVAECLQRPEYVQRMDALHGCFNHPDAMARGSSADEPTGHFACRMILKRHKKAAEIARSITSKTPDSTVHALRIECKKLRYLMEFFSPLFPQKEIKALVKSLKELQDILGRFNDCSMQRESLAAFVDAHPMRGRKGLKVAESVGALGATLFQRQLSARVEIDACLGGFSNESTRNQFKKLFSKGDTE